MFTSAVLAMQAPEPVSPGFDFFDFGTPSNVVLMVGFFIPIITGLIVKEVAHPRVKAISTMVLSILAATIGTIVAQDGGWAWREFGNAFLSAFIPAIAVYYGFLKPSGISGAVQHATSNFGLLVKSQDEVNVVSDPGNRNDEGQVRADVASTGHLVAEGTLQAEDALLRRTEDMLSRKAEEKLAAADLTDRQRKEVHTLVAEALNAQRREFEGRLEHVDGSARHDAPTHPAPDERHLG